MIFADSGFFIAQLKPHDELHKRASEWSRFVAEAGTRILTTEYVLIELGDALSAPADRGKFHAALKRLRQATDVEIIPASSALFQQGAALHCARPDKEWSLTDCLSFIVMQEHGVMRALAYDHHFEQAGFEALLRREPLNP
jgi:predicted nucleic acid-binding protein